MSFANKIAIAVNLNAPMSDVLKGLKELDFLNKGEVHFLNIYLTSTYAIGLGESSIIYPVESDQRIIREQTIAKLSEMARSLLPLSFKGQVICECLFSDNPKRRFCDYVDEKKVDTIVVAAREKRGLFESSFTQFVTKHTKANMIILKHKV
jgi:hypothetical protein